MTKLGLISLGLVISLSAWSQQLHPVLNIDTGNTIGMFASAGMASNSLHPSFISSVYSGRPLSRGQRENQLNLMNETNRIGGDLDYGLYYGHIPDSSALGWYLTLSSHTNANMAFSKDLYHLAFLGNADFGGSTASLDFKLQLWDYKKLGGGFMYNKRVQTAELRVGLGANFLMVNRHMVAEFKDSELFTQEFGEYLDVQANGQIMTSGMNAGGYMNYSGYGFSGDVFAQVSWPKHTLTFQALDIGGAFLERAHQHYSIDSSFRYDGIHVNLFSTEGEPFSNIQLDSLQERIGLREFSGKSYSAVLPSIFHIRSAHKMGQGNWTLFAGIQYRLAAYFPMMYLGARFNLPENFWIQPAFAWGGFGSWNVGLEVSKRFGDLATLTIGTNNLEGAILPDMATGQGAYTKLEFHLR